MGRWIYKSINFDLYGNVRGLQIKVFSVGGGVYVVLC